MQLVEFGDLLPAARQSHPLDAWAATLQGICGSFNPEPHAHADRVRGTVRGLGAGGLDVAHVANDLDLVRRERQDISRDQGENLFLLLQLEGVCGVEQHGCRSLIAPGDCILVDSASPSLFQFGGGFSNHLSVHLPRQLLLQQGSRALAISRRLGAEDPMSLMLQALVAKLLETAADDRRAPQLRQLLFNAIAAAFADDDGPEGPELSAIPDGAAQRIELAQLLIDRHLTEWALTPQWLACRLGVSLRTLQADFGILGTTATALIRVRRLRLARERLVQRGPRSGRAATVADIALASGFSDISYFNRCFRKEFGCAPTDFLDR